jgi:hypothetical protein
MDATTEYKILSTEEGVAPETDGGWKLYPGERRGDRVMDVVSCGPPAGSLLLKTGGNALQAVDRDVLDKQNVISVVVPDGMDPGDTILVTCPFWTGRLISTTIPPGALPGHVFLVRTPPIMPEVVTGVPLDKMNNESDIQVVNGVDIIAAAIEKELALRVENTRTQTRTTQDEEVGFEEVPGASHNEVRDRQKADDGFEMVPNQRNQPISSTRSGLVAAMFACKHII